MRKILLTLLALSCLGWPMPSYAGLSGRDCYGPIALNTAMLYGPGPNGTDEITKFDGDMTVHVWQQNSKAISIQVQSSLFTAVEDPTGASFKTNATLTSTDEITLKGPITRVRFYMATCEDSACLASVKICGRIAR